MATKLFQGADMYAGDLHRLKRDAAGDIVLTVLLAAVVVFLIVVIAIMTGLINTPFWR